MKMLPLPSLSRLAQILKGLPCKYGFNPVCLEAIQKQFHGKADEQRLGSLILDEIKLRQAYDFNKCSYKMDGFVDYGGVTNEGTHQLADHALVIKDFLVMLDTTEFNHNTKNTLLFASRQTTESLRVTLLSIIDIIDELHKAGVPYVLTAKLNQDPLERFFGIVRSFHGDDDHPTIIQFSQIYRLLSLFTPLRNAVKGNCLDRLRASSFQFMKVLLKRRKRQLS
ncbi:hypothetical protein HPB51_001000 [Rhipicephalus microplus]|uniref:Transposable element n=1 Tax=Rhipicephalus microplus TaxID=6941 RepID=A0A9J6DE24_RHIMP|nr:hypothetical protein HPB51_001000 [Rhipicephalus microplus]